VSKLRWILLVCGIVLFAVLAAEIGPGAVAAAFERLSWRLLIVLWFPFVVVNVCDTLGWLCTLPRGRVPFTVAFAARLTGESFNATTPAASLGGEPVKVALLRAYVRSDEGVTSVVVAKTTITVSQVLFLGACLPLVGARADVNPLFASTLRWAFVLELLAVGGFVLVQATGFLGSAVQSFYRRAFASVAGSTLCHFLGWVTSALEGYVILRLLGTPVSLTTAFAVEASATAVRFASFMIPAHVGALEGGVVGTFVALGLDAASGLSFILVRRLRELAWVALGFALIVRRRSPGGGLVSSPEVGRAPVGG
jgi:glycosyltransferase 2 family protein